LVGNALASLVETLRVRLAGQAPGVSACLTLTPTLTLTLLILLVCRHACRNIDTVMLDRAAAAAMGVA
jgi:hypothetical protein